MTGIVVVTGAAGGIGRAVARSLARAGARLALVDREREALQQIAGELGAVASVSQHVVDLTDGVALVDLARELEAGAPVQGLVNAAGIIQLGTIHELDEQAFGDVLAINLTTVFLTCKAFMPALERCDGAAIVNIASMSGRTRSIHTSPGYVASKAGVIGLTMALAGQHATAGVRVNCVAPGVIDTPMLGDYDDEMRTRIAGSTPLGRLGSAREVADAIVYLLSSQASFVTGHTLDVNGGLFIH